MIRGTGLDLVEISRMADSLARHGASLRDRVFTPGEQAYCEAQARPELHYAARFAAKEAFSKAIGTGIGGDASWRDIAVAHDERGRPTLEVTGAALQRMHALGATSAHLSITHAGDYAAAVVIIEGDA